MVECFVNLSMRWERDISGLWKRLREDKTELFQHMLFNSPATISRILSYSHSFNFNLKVSFFLIIYSLQSDFQES